MKYGTICSKHNNIINASKSIEVELQNIYDVVSDVESFQQFKESAHQAIIDSLKKIENIAYDIKSDAEKCLDDGQRMEDGLVSKQTTINDLCDERDAHEKTISELEDKISDLQDQINSFEEQVSNMQSTIDMFEAEEYNRQING